MEQKACGDSKGGGMFELLQDDGTDSETEGEKGQGEEREDEFSDTESDEGIFVARCPSDDTSTELSTHSGAEETKGFDAPVHDAPPPCTVHSITELRAQLQRAVLELVHMQGPQLRQREWQLSQSFPNSKYSLKEKDLSLPYYWNHFQKFHLTPKLRLATSVDGVESTAEHIRVHLERFTSPSNGGTNRQDGVRVTVAPLRSHLFASLSDIQVSKQAHSEAVPLADVQRHWQTLRPHWGVRGGSRPCDGSASNAEEATEQRGYHLYKVLGAEGDECEHKRLDLFKFKASAHGITQLIFQHLARHISSDHSCAIRLGVEDNSDGLEGLVTGFECPFRFEDSDEVLSDVRQAVYSAVRTLLFPPISTDCVSVCFHPVMRPPAWDTDSCEPFVIFAAAPTQPHMAIRLDVHQLDWSKLPTELADSPPRWWRKLCGLGEEPENKEEGSSDDDADDDDADDDDVILLMLPQSMETAQELLIPDWRKKNNNNVMKFPSSRELTDKHHNVLLALTAAFTPAELAKAACLDHKLVVQVDLQSVPRGTDPVAFCKNPPGFFKHCSTDESARMFNEFGNFLIPHPLEAFNRVRQQPSHALCSFIENPAYTHCIVGDVRALPPDIDARKWCDPLPVDGISDEILRAWEFASVARPHSPICVWAVATSEEKGEAVAQCVANGVQRVQTHTTTAVKVVVVGRDGPSALAVLSALDEQETAPVSVFDVVIQHELPRLINTSTTCDVSSCQDIESALAPLRTILGCQVGFKARVGSDSPSEIPAAEDMDEPGAQAYLAYREPICDALLAKRVPAHSDQFQRLQHLVEECLRSPDQFSVLTLQKMTPCCGATTLLAQLRQHFDKDIGPTLQVLSLDASFEAQQSEEALVHGLRGLLELQVTVLLLVDESRRDGRLALSVNSLRKILRNLFAESDTAVDCPMSPAATADNVGPTPTAVASSAGAFPASSSAPVASSTHEVSNSTAAGPSLGRAVVVRVSPAQNREPAVPRWSSVPVTSELCSGDDYEKFATVFDHWFKSNVLGRRDDFLNNKDGSLLPDRHFWHVAVCALCDHYGVDDREKSGYAGIPVLVKFAFDKAMQGEGNAQNTDWARWWWSAARVAALITAMRCQYRLKALVRTLIDRYRANRWSGCILSVSPQGELRLLLPILAQAVLRRQMHAADRAQVYLLDAGPPDPQFTVVETTTRPQARQLKSAQFVKDEFRHALNFLVKSRDVAEMLRFAEHVLVRDRPRFSNGRQAAFSTLTQVAVDTMDPDCVEPWLHDAMVAQSCMTDQLVLLESLMSGESDSRRLRNLVHIRARDAADSQTMLDDLMCMVVDGFLGNYSGEVFNPSHDDSRTLLHSVPHWNLLRSRVWRSKRRHAKDRESRDRCSARQRFFINLAYQQVETLRSTANESFSHLYLNPDTAVVKHYALYCAHQGKREDDTGKSNEWFDKAYRASLDWYNAVRRSNSPLDADENKPARKMIEEARTFLSPWTAIPGEARKWLHELGEWSPRPAMRAEPEPASAAASAAPQRVRPPLAQQLMHPGLPSPSGDVIRSTAGRGESQLALLHQWLHER